MQSATVPVRIKIICLLRCNHRPAIIVAVASRSSFFRCWEVHAWQASMVPAFENRKDLHILVVAWVMHLVSVIFVCHDGIYAQYMDDP